jgi:hypothetical protein
MLVLGIRAEPAMKSEDRDRARAALVAEIRSQVPSIKHVVCDLEPS